ncbi:MAG: orotate phosphoribosyltransferase [Trueperaceae bacterium]|nr:MAG: orotate phosphoribosyltransferase [Trueperaceae bacterium]
MPSTELAREIFEVAHLTGEFLLRSGVISKEYFDKYLFETDPALLLEIARSMVPMVPLEAELLGGLELGGIPLATVMSQLTGLPSLFIRKEAKAYGTRKLAEGGGFSGKNVLLVEDVITSGGQVILSAEALRALGATVDHAVCVIDREAGGREALAEAGIDLKPLFTMGELKAAARNLR